jgi:hypothetical protein
VPVIESQPKTMPRGIIRYPTMVAVVPPRPEIIQSCPVSQERRAQETIQPKNKTTGVRIR